MQIQGENTVVIEVPPLLCRLDPLQNVQYLKPYKTKPPELGPQRDSLSWWMARKNLKFEYILAHHIVGKLVEYLTRFKSY